MKALSSILAPLRFRFWCDLDSIKTYFCLASIVFFVVTFTGVAEERSTKELELKDLPGGVHGHRVHRLGERVAVFGGYGSKATAFDLKNAKWMPFPPMNVPKAFFGSVMVKGQIYAIGGDPQTEEAAVIERFDEEEKKWEIVLRSEKLPKSHLSTAALGEKIFIVGGFPQNGANILVFDVGSGKLAEIKEIPGAEKGDHLHFVAEMGGNLHVLGGMRFAGEAGLLNEHWMWDGGKWHQRAVLPKKSFAKMGAYGMIQDALYVFGDVNQVYDPKTDAWSKKLAPLPVMLVMPAFFAEKDSLFVLGGLNPVGSGPSKSVLQYNATRNLWKESK